MSVRTETLEDKEPPPNPAAVLARKMSRAMLLILCASPIAILAVALAHRAMRYLFS